MAIYSRRDSNQYPTTSSHFHTILYRHVTSDQRAVRLKTPNNEQLEKNAHKREPGTCENVSFALRLASDIKKERYIGTIDFRIDENLDEIYSRC